MDSDPNFGNVTPARDRLAELAHRWRVAVDQAVDTPSSVIAFGRRGHEPVVLKVVKQPGDEWRSGDVLRAFDGRGTVRVLEHVDGAVLLERLDPASPLVDLVRRGDDEMATATLCDVIQALVPQSTPAWCPTVRDWARGFGRYRTSGDRGITPDVVARAERCFLRLCESQHAPRLLHGDLQHYNVLFDRNRGWIAIDPKGVIGEREYEVGAALRNPVECPELVADRVILERRLATFVSRLGVDRQRVIEWGFAQAVLSAIWQVEDGERVDSTDPSLRLAATLLPMLDEP